MLALTSLQSVVNLFPLMYFKLIELSKLFSTAYLFHSFSVSIFDNLFIICRDFLYDFFIYITLLNIFYHILQNICVELCRLENCVKSRKNRRFRIDFKAFLFLRQQVIWLKKRLLLVFFLIIVFCVSPLTIIFNFIIIL